MSDEDERDLTLIWVATIEGGAVARWRLIEDNAANRRTWALDDGQPSVR
jgi:hypothetical protein